MKPIILVIVGAAMLMPVMRHHNAPHSAQARKRKAKHASYVELKNDSGTSVHGTGFWIERLP